MTLKNGIEILVGQAILGLLIETIFCMFSSIIQELLGPQNVWCHFWISQKICFKRCVDNLEIMYKICSILILDAVPPESDWEDILEANTRKYQEKYTFWQTKHKACDWRKWKKGWESLSFCTEGKSKKVTMIAKLSIKLLNWKISIFMLCPTESGRQTLFKNLRLCAPLKSSDDTDVILGWLSEVYDNLAMVDYPYPASFLEPLPAYPIKVNVSEGSSKYIASFLPLRHICTQLKYTSRRLLIKYVGLISHSTAVTNASWSIVKGTLQLLWHIATVHTLRVYPRRYSNLH